MRWLLYIALLTALVIFQASVLPALFPYLLFNLALVYLAALTFRLERYQVLLCAVWAGLVQDVLYGRMLGLFMLLNFVALALAWEVKEDFFDSPKLTWLLRVVAASLSQELVLAFLHYAGGYDSGLGFVLQFNAGRNLLANLLALVVLMAGLRFRGKEGIGRFLEGKR